MQVLEFSTLAYKTLVLNFVFSGCTSVLKRFRFLDTFLPLYYNGFKILHLFIVYIIRR